MSDNCKQIRNCVVRGKDHTVSDRYSSNDNMLPQLEMDASSSSQFGTESKTSECKRYDSTFITQTTFLRPRMKFTGYQTSGYKRYYVDVVINTVNLPRPMSDSTAANTACSGDPSTSLSGNSTLVPHMTGCITIPGLANNHRRITTFFEAYLVTDSEYGFFTSSWIPQSSWNYDSSQNYNASLTASDQIDLEHWLSFPAFKQLFLQKPELNSDLNLEQEPNMNRNRNRNYIADYINQRYIFMRWKEKFLVPNPFLDSTEGASYDGFYYIVHDQYTGSIQGFYYHKDAEKFQQLELMPVGDQCDGGAKDSDEVFLLNTDCSFEFV